MNEENTANEFSRTFNLDLVEKKATEIIIEATSDECLLLAERFSIIEVVSLKATCILNRRKQKELGDYLLRVKMDAEVIQSCVVTLNEVHESINEEFSIIFQKNAPPSKNNNDSQEVVFNIDDDDVEIIEDKEVDIGEYVAEYLALFMNSYPRQNEIKGEELGYKILSEDEATKKLEKKNPFAVLKEL